MTAATDPSEAAIRDLVGRVMAADVAEIDALEAGLGTRRFYRVRLAGGQPGSVIARVEQPEDDALRPAGVPPEPPLEPIRRLLEQAGLPVARRWGGAAGVELLEDLGDESLQHVAREGPTTERDALYEEACALVPRLQALQPPPQPVAAFARRLDDALFAYKAEQLITWGLPWLRGSALSPAEAARVRDAFGEIAREAAAAPGRLSHRDFKAANLHVRRDGDRPRLVMIDLQGAFLAPPEYDLVCLLRDLQSPLPLALADRLRDATRPALPDAPCPDVFERRFTLLTLSRVGKDLSRYVYVERERSDARNASLLPNAVASLREAAARAATWSSALEDLADLLHAPAGPGS